MFKNLRNSVTKVVLTSAVGLSILFASAMPAHAANYYIGAAYMSMRTTSEGFTVSKVSRTDYYYGVIKSANVVLCDNAGSIPATGTLYTGSLPSGCSIVSSVGSYDAQVFAVYTGHTFTPNCNFAGISWVNSQTIGARWVRNDTPQGWSC